MTKVPTARDLLIANKDRFESTSVHIWLIEFARLHVKAALKAALEEVPYGSSTDTVSYEDVVGILTCYPESLIQ